LSTARRDTLAFGAAPTDTLPGRLMPAVSLPLPMLMYLKVRDFDYHIASNRCAHER
jgi:hypothetical protein